mmetsp:Transcript_33125/g.71585  ORF Transcript_33125/g.71585 Transcript_33125/m.71585 type:complete len:116 (-) Transcript_33125:586-933(-)
MKTNFASAPCHEQSQYCITTAAQKEQHDNAEVVTRVMDKTFTVYGVQLERVETFKYLGHTIRYDNSNTQAVCNNLSKARRTWGRLSHVMKVKNASPRVCGFFLQGHSPSGPALWE